MPNPNNFLLNTDYPLDKIVYMDEGSWTPTSLDPEYGTEQTSIIFATGIQATNFVCGEWSEDDFATSFPIGSTVSGGYYQRDPNSLIYGIVKGVEAFCAWGGVNIVVQNYAYKEIKFRFYVLISESEWNADSNPTAGLSNRLVLDTRENYPRLVEDRIIEIQANTPFVLNHNLGHRPFVRVWEGWNSDDPTERIFMPESNSIQSITNNQITFYSTWANTLYYRIYTDEI